MGVGDWLSSISDKKAIVLLLVLLVFFDMLLYYISGLCGHHVPSYPLLSNLFDSLMKIDIFY